MKRIGILISAWIFLPLTGFARSADVPTIEVRFRDRIKPCGYSSDLGTIDARVADCETVNAETKSADGAGLIEELDRLGWDLVMKPLKGDPFFMDGTQGGLIWSPMSVKPLPYGDLPGQAGKECENRRDLGLKWRLPTTAEYQDAEKRKIRQVLNMYPENAITFYFWSLLEEGKVSSKCFSGLNGIFINTTVSEGYERNVRCVPVESSIPK
jgi:hypothetical protein